MMNPYWHWGNNGMWSMNRWGFCLEVLAWLLIAALFVWLYIRFGRHIQASNGSHTAAALDILKNRYAKGEISQEEFLNMKDHLK